MPLMYECHYCDWREETSFNEDRFCSTCDTQICSECGIYHDESGDWYCEDCQADRGHVELENVRSQPAGLTFPDATYTLDSDDDPWDDPGENGGT